MKAVTEDVGRNNREIVYESVNEGGRDLPTRDHQERLEQHWRLDETLRHPLWWSQ